MILVITYGPAATLRMLRPEHLAIAVGTEILSSGLRL